MAGPSIITSCSASSYRSSRAPGQRARVLLHCRRFAELSYAQLLARDYQFGQNIATDSELTAWLDQTCLTPQKHL